MKILQAFALISLLASNVTFAAPGKCVDSDNCKEAFATDSTFADQPKKECEGDSCRE